MIKLKGLLNESGISSLTNYYKRGNSDARLSAKKIDDTLKKLITDKKQLESLTRLITDLADAVADDRLDSYKDEV